MSIYVRVVLYHQTHFYLVENGKQKLEIDIVLAIRAIRINFIKEGNM